MDDLFGDLPPPCRMKIDSFSISRFFRIYFINLVVYFVFSASEGDVSSSVGNLYDDVPTPERRENKVNKRKLATEDGDCNELPTKRSVPRKMMLP